MPHKLTARTNVRNSQRFNPLNTSPFNARVHVYEEPIKMSDPTARGIGRYRRRKTTQDI